MEEPVNIIGLLQQLIKTVEALQHTIQFVGMACLVLLTVLLLKISKKRDLPNKS
jgi:threonine/homoserine/homoserine lactone efflux protein